MMARNWVETETLFSCFCLIINIKLQHLKCHFPVRTCLLILTHESVFFFPVPKMQFKERVYTCSEHDARVVAMIYRSGDVQHRSSVRCYTRQGSAQVMMDFEERPNTDVSVITFLPGVYELENDLNLLLYLLILCVCAWGGGEGACHSWHEVRRQVLGVGISLPPTLWIWRIKLRSSRLWRQCLKPLKFLYVI